MKVSLNAARSHSNVDLAPNGIDELVAKIGAQIGAVEEVIDYHERYKDIVAVKVVTCEKHPNADTLTICQVDDGQAVKEVDRNENGLVQVVCGAPNVREGMFVAWIPPGATVPATYDKEPFVLSSKELRGVVSNGMLASADELGINNDHDGLLEINVEDTGADELSPGTSFSDLYGTGDYVIEIENKMFTHRPDCFGVLGVAREIAGIYGQAFVSPDWYKNKPTFQEVSELELRIENELPDLVPRFMAVAMSNVEVKPSPLWMQAGLMRVGIKPINNVVDATNYLAYITGQPLHAYDYEKVKSLSDAEPVLVVRYPKKGELITLLNGKTIEPRAEAMMIATDQKLIGIGGVMGGAETEVDDGTSSIIIECANFDMYSIRRTSMAHGLFTDAVTRNNKGQSPLQNDRVLFKAMDIMQELAGAQQASNVYDDRHVSLVAHDSQIGLHGEISISADFINSRLGLNLAADEVKKLLENVEFHVEKSGDSLTVNAPFWRTDIAIPEDIVEEVGRMVGFETLPLELPKRSILPAKIDSKLELKKQIRRLLASFGANEVLTYSFVHENMLKKAGQDSTLAFKLSNALSPDLQYYRMSLTPSLLAQVHPNIKAGHDKFVLFELNKSHIKLHKDDDDGLPKELDMVTMVVASKNKSGAAYFLARAYLDCLADRLGFELTYLPIDQPVDYQVMKPFDYTRSALVYVKGTEILLGCVGEYTQATIKAMKLPQYCAGFEVGLNYIEEAVKNRATNYTVASKFPVLTQDICFETDAELSYRELSNSLDEALLKTSSDDVSADFSLIDIYVNKDNAHKKRTTFRITFTSYRRTLTETLASSQLQQVEQFMADAVGAQRI